MKSDLLLLLVKSLLIGILTWGVNKIWRLSFSKLTRLTLIALLWLSYVGIFYLAVKCNMEKKIDNFIPEEVICQLKESYEEHKKINIQDSISEEILREITEEEYIKVTDLLELLRQINYILSDPWVNDFEEDKINSLHSLRTLIAESIRSSFETNDTEAMTSFNEAEKFEAFFEGQVLNKDQIKFYKLLINQGSRPAIEYIESLFFTEEGLRILENLLCNKNQFIATINFLEKSIDSDIFTDIVRSTLVNLFQQIEMFSGRSLKTHTKEKINNHITHSIDTIERRKKIIEDIEKISNVFYLSIESISSLARTNRNNTYEEQSNLIKQAQDCAFIQFNNVIEELTI